MADHGNSTRQFGRADISENPIFGKGVHDEISTLLGAEKKLQRCATRGTDESL